MASFAPPGDGFQQNFSPHHHGHFHHKGKGKGKGKHKGFQHYNQNAQWFPNPQQHMAQMQAAQTQMQGQMMLQLQEGQQQPQPQPPQPQHNFQLAHFKGGAPGGNVPNVANWAMEKFDPSQQKPFQPFQQQHQGQFPLPQKKRYFRRTVDFASTVVNFLETWRESENKKRIIGCNYTYTKDLLPAFATPYHPYDAICTRYVYSAVNKVRSAVNTVTFSPNGRRVITGSHTGEMTIWNANQFHFENNMQAHTAAIRALCWSPAEEILLSGDSLGQIKLWDQYFYNSQNFQAHKESLREISMSSTGQKFATCADDSHAKVWDFKTLQEERTFSGHGWDVKCCSWHPSKGLVATGSKDCQVKLWDPRVGEAITTIHPHKNMVTRVKWSSEGNWLISGGRDTTVALMDIRTMKVRRNFKGHSREVTALCWHPEFEDVFCSGGFDGSLIYWDLWDDKPLEAIPHAHDATIWAIAWHPFGHLVASGSHDNCCRFWSRCRPGDKNIKELVPKREHRFGFDNQKQQQAKEEETEQIGELPKPVCTPDRILSCGIFATTNTEETT
eukprot:GEMP01032283.1.p1 GENE.GEMP01032283.1~~GEMP01032283.1.p1  ORF type:complete len:556 (+),score=122.18 GEMP01032283.1:281-1948(+)